jgi:hypothetical protein
LSDKPGEKAPAGLKAALSNKAIPFPSTYRKGGSGTSASKNNLKYCE